MPAGRRGDQSPFKNLADFAAPFYPFAPCLLALSDFWRQPLDGAAKIRKITTLAARPSASPPPCTPACAQSCFLGHLFASFANTHSNSFVPILIRRSSILPATFRLSSMIFGGSTRGMASLALLAALYQSGLTAVVAADQELSVTADSTNYWAAPEPTLGLDCVDDKIYSKDGETVCITEGQAICFDSGTDDNDRGLGNVAFGIKQGRAQVFNNRNQPVSIRLFIYKSVIMLVMRYSNCIFSAFS